MGATEPRDNPINPDPLLVSQSDLLAISFELVRLCWSEGQARSYVSRQFSKRSRSALLPSEAAKMLADLRSFPSNPRPRRFKP